MLSVAPRDVTTLPAFVARIADYAADGTTSADAKGPLIDNFSLSAAAVSAAPESLGWAYMLVGFGGAGAILRARRTAS